ncbi:ESIB-like protein [Mya arenaria]|uniref:ESIB-like protein n=1 Tax=Mya arenaria TaxID=6604 RepID=A0ABY7ESD9_MYAAR|nr:secretory immunoglobulin A-binding protein EsiB-like [Mya arenaria]WAR12160.1 ESIB-like protein [Mya arenaria]
MKRMSTGTSHFVTGTFQTTQHPREGASSCNNVNNMATASVGMAQSGGVRQRFVEDADPDWDPTLPYGGKVFLARKKKSDPLHIRAVEGFALCVTITFAFYAYFYFDHLHFHVTHAYAHLGYPSAQHQVGQRYLHGKGVEKDHEMSMKWFRKASDQGHPHAAYNLAVGHLKGMKTDLKPGEAHKLIHHAASKGVKQAHKVLNNVCTRGGCSN